MSDRLHKSIPAGRMARMIRPVATAAVAAGGAKTITGQGTTA